MRESKEIIIFIALSALLLIGIGFLPKSAANLAVNHVIQSSGQVQ
ncbi:hypothetical protein Desaci_0660 [Desulfosporosinus acidiphilus SJ4]|uniref:Uncharacterized protein n=1 Tax=Desulfosporosinus acidiphilus (strain DSM 22704 / JCM 16185 / SJ4) TaxID=646529 RepID=I4D1P7_DESAJ|nr:hypothetical protein [Desulfosporosinus acidiphilus]AFM39721.1 hypothetical protein Desaci_0660 [Desulfosporosinus acidiphilus SJ4]